MSNEEDACLSNEESILMLKAGTWEDFGGSMAEAIDREFVDMWNMLYPQNPLPDKGKKYRRLLFIAIAKGVIKHLRDRTHEGFDVKIDVIQIPKVNLITSSGESHSPTEASDYSSHTHFVSVTQSEDIDDPCLNRVKSKGKGVIRITMEEDGTEESAS